MAGLNYKSVFDRVGIGVIVLAAGGWLVALQSSWQIPSSDGTLLEDESRVPRAPACGELLDSADIDSVCVPGASQAGQLMPDHTVAVHKGQPAQADVLDLSDESSPLESIRYIDIYDPSTWPVDPNDSVDLPDIVPIDLYDPSTWPVETGQDDVPAVVEPIDLYDPNTWPSNAASQTESAPSSVDGINVYDPATWPHAIGSAASGDAIVPIDPYDATTWPES